MQKFVKFKSQFKLRPIFEPENDAYYTIKDFAETIIEYTKGLKSERCRRTEEFLGCEEHKNRTVVTSFEPYKANQAIVSMNMFIRDKCKIKSVHNTHPGGNPVMERKMIGKKINGESLEYLDCVVYGEFFIVYNGTKIIVDIAFTGDNSEIEFICHPKDKRKMTEFDNDYKRFSRENDMYNRKKLNFMARGYLDFLNYPSIGWDDVVLDVNMKREIQQNIVYPLKNGQKIKKNGIPWRRGMLLGGPPGCHDDKTLVVTPQGLKKYTDMKRGDTVLALDVNENVVENKIKDIVEFNHDGPMKYFKSNTYDFGVTFGHRMRTMDQLKRRGWKYQSAESITKAYFPVRGNAFGGKLSGTFDIHEYIDTNKKLKFPLKSHMKSKLQPLNIDDFLSLVGWYISEGSIFKTKRGDYVQIRQDSKYNGEIHDLIERMNLNFGEYENGTKFIIFHQDLAEYMKRCGIYSENKMIPKEILELDASLLIHIFNSLISGDGSGRRTTAKDYYTVSNHLKDDMMVLSLKLGFSTSFTGRDRTNEIQIFNGRQIQPNFPELCVHTRMGNVGTQGWVDKRNISEYYYKGKVWCFETEHGNFFTCRNGKIACSGNTGKTQVCKVLCNALQNITVLWSTPKSLYSEDQIRKLFEAARYMKPALIIIEDIDFIGTSREFSQNPILGELLTQMDGNDPNDGVFVVATTNRKAILDDALANRPGRFDVILEFPLPHSKERRKLIDIFSKDVLFNKERNDAINEITEATNGLTGAQIKEIFVYNSLKKVDKTKELSIEDICDKASKFNKEHDIINSTNDGIVYIG